MTYPTGNHPDAPLERDADQSLYGMPGWAVETMLHCGFTVDEMLLSERPRDFPIAEVVDLNVARLRYLRLGALNRLARARM